MDLGLTGKAVLVSGASRGIGLAIARTFATEGARVVLTARSAGPLEAAAVALRDEGATVLALAADMSREEDIAAAFDAADAAFGPLEAVVANVGSGIAQPGFDIGREEWERVLAGNLLAGTQVAREALRRMTSRRRGSLTFITSIAGVEAIRAPLAYSAAKAALQAAMKLYAQQVGPLGVRVNAVAPGNVLFPGGSWERKLAERKEFFEDYIRSEVALQRFASVEEIADVAVFLASPRAGFATGSVWVVDGGQTRSW